MFLLDQPKRNNCIVLSVLQEDIIPLLYSWEFPRFEKRNLSKWRRSALRQHWRHTVLAYCVTSLARWLESGVARDRGATSVVAVDSTINHATTNYFAQSKMMLNRYKSHNNVTFVVTAVAVVVVFQSNQLIATFSCFFIVTNTPPPLGIFCMLPYPHVGVTTSFFSGVTTCHLFYDPHHLLRRALAFSLAPLSSFFPRHERQDLRLLFLLLLLICVGRSSFQVFLPLK